jgi:hypothetical protein
VFLNSATRSADESNAVAFPPKPIAGEPLETVRHTAIANVVLVLACDQLGINET